MQRVRPFRMTIGRLGLLLLAWHALVLQGLLAGPIGTAHAADWLHKSEICIGLEGTTSGGPEAPVHDRASCVCIAHASTAASAPPPAMPDVTINMDARGADYVLPAKMHPEFGPRLFAAARGPPQMKQHHV